MEIKLAEIIVITLSVFIPLAGGMFGIIWTRLNRAEDAKQLTIAAINESITELRNSTSKQSDTANHEIKEDIKNMAESMLKTIDNLESKINEIMFNMINNGKR